MYRVPLVRNQDESNGSGQSDSDSSGTGNSNGEMGEENGSEGAEAEDPDEFDVILGAEGEGKGVKRKHVDRVFDRLSRAGKVEFDFGETGPICMGTDSKLSMMVQLAFSECRFLGEEEDEYVGESDGNLDAMFRTRQNSAGCKGTERTAREVRMRNCMVEVLEWTDGEGKVNMTAVGEHMGGTRMGKRFVVDHLQNVAGCAKKAYYVVEKYKEEILEWMRSVEECRVGEDGELVAQRSAQGLPGLPIQGLISTLLDSDDDDDDDDYDDGDYQLAYENYEDYFIPTEDDVLQGEEVEEEYDDTGYEQCAASCSLQFGGDYYDYDEYEDYGRSRLMARQKQRPKPNKSKRPNGQRPSGGQKNKGQGGKTNGNGGKNNKGKGVNKNNKNKNKNKNKGQGVKGNAKKNGKGVNKSKNKGKGGANKSKGKGGVNKNKGKKGNGGKKNKGGKNNVKGGNQKKGGNKNKGNGSNKNKGGKKSKGKGVNNKGQGARPNGNKGKGQKGNAKGKNPSKGKGNGKGKGKATGAGVPNKENMESVHDDDTEDNYVMDQGLIDEIKEMSDEQLLLAAKNVLTLGCIQKSYGESCKLYIMDTILSRFPTPKPPIQVDPIILDDIHGGWLIAQPIDDPKTDDGPYPEFPPDSPNSQTDLSQAQSQHRPVVSE